MMGVGQTERSEFRLVLTRVKELPELAGARSGLRNEISHFIADGAPAPFHSRCFVVLRLISSIGRIDMFVGRLPRRGVVGLVLAMMFVGCSSGDAPSYALDKELARGSVQKAMQAWVDGKKPKDLQPDIVVGDTAWEQGKKLVSFEIKADEETTDGSNLYIRVKRTIGSSESNVTYIVGTTPVVTIFPQ